MLYYKQFIIFIVIHHNQEIFKNETTKIILFLLATKYMPSQYRFYMYYTSTLYVIHAFYYTDRLRI